MIRSNGCFGATISCATAFAAMAAVALATVLAVAPAAVSQDVTNGERIWKSKAGCPQCHGWAGDGFPSGFHSEGNAPSLRETQLTRDQIRETIQCGRARERRCRILTASPILTSAATT
jgi:Spy/CpxP family protein refolding chaperone